VCLCAHLQKHLWEVMRAHACKSSFCFSFFDSFAGTVCQKVKVHEHPSVPHRPVGFVADPFELKVQAFIFPSRPQCRGPHGQYPVMASTPSIAYNSQTLLPNFQHYGGVDYFFIASETPLQHTVLQLNYCKHNQHLPTTSKVCAMLDTPCSLSANV
jgi:hypothetical protein